MRSEVHFALGNTHGASKIGYGVGIG
jgi:hypothetical protein